MPAQLPDSHAVDTTAEVAGDLLQWLRAASGEWLGLVTYHSPSPTRDTSASTWSGSCSPPTRCGQGSTVGTASSGAYGSVTRVGGVTSVPDPGPIRRGPSGPAAGVRASTAA
jgi:hypothetical protein